VLILLHLEIRFIGSRRREQETGRASEARLWSSMSRVWDAVLRGLQGLGGPLKDYVGMLLPGERKERGADRAIVARARLGENIRGCALSTGRRPGRTRSLLAKVRELVVPAVTAPQPLEWC